MALYHDGKHNESLNICDKSSKIKRMYLPLEEKTDFNQFVNIHCNIFGMKYHKSLFIGLVWVIPMEQKLFHHFPDVIRVDTVH